MPNGRCGLGSGPLLLMITRSKMSALLRVKDWEHPLHNTGRLCEKSDGADSRVMSDTIESDMTYITGYDRSQLLLLPEAVDDYVGSDNPVRFIDAFVDGLDLAAAGFDRVAPKVTGRPAYAPEDLLKLYIYGYLNRCNRAAGWREKPTATSR